VVPLSAERVLLKITIHRSTHDKMLHAQNLLGHQLPSGALEQVLDRAIDALIEKLEKRKYGATDQPRKSARASVNPRYVSAHVKRAVRERDRDRCTFVAQDGHRCEARKFLEFDHALPVARGGQSTIGNLRLRCRAHNQYAAEQDYGCAFMETKRAEAVRARGSEAGAERARLAREKAEEVVPWLQALGIRADHARQAAARCAEMPGATLEERVKAALRHFGPRDVALRQAAPA
jgi:hypothetical protein